ncbi:nuclear transport factor 2 family protein [Polaribacter vadi]|uniref:nuclear transport factor 2 family protein n=1 Tax=Polaribacter TaxID=52959 RepID=UPI001C09D3F9|nr:MULTISPECIES: nuclear transport factor 2 family protein [Polaribacter]MBU3011473.1 nuclear transport factor 2 family protein [Polaribacter vadi]MDO6741285.1 nuclear transport factor 2 family protein [Polaribacter sp. 1_MG-2023]
MHKIITYLVILIFSVTISAQQKSEETAVKKVIETFFEGLHKGDSTLLKSTLHKNIKIQTTSTNKEGVHMLKTDTKEKLLISVANKKLEDIYLEKLLSIDIKIDENLASVWTPYEFYFNGKFSHCGANSFQLFNNNGNWEIIYLVDMRRRENCKALKEKK